MNGKTANSTLRDWGRRKNASAFSGVAAVAIMVAAPTMVLLFSIAMKLYDGALLTAFGSMTVHDFWQNIDFRATLPMHAVITAYILFQAVLYRFLPGFEHEGQLTPAGYVLRYKTNGLLACAVTCAVLGAGEITGLMKASFIAANWSSLIVALNMWGVFVSIAVYVKARIAPTHAEDVVFSGNLFYDLFMGAELNPQLELLGDLKLFINGRLGMMAWPLMYLQTIDIAHDHVGYYLCWGCIAWLPTMYTLQAQYLARSPGHLSGDEAVTVFLIGVAGYLLFRSANNQKYRVRNSQGQCKIWGKPATFIVGHYTTSDGVMRKSLLLTNGWWGMARHVNYLGDLIMAYSMCAACGTTHILPWFYALFMSLILCHRCYRDEARCEMKYGSYWKAYCNQVKWRIVPYLF